MVPAAVHQRRRRALASRIDGPILLSGNGPRARNLPAMHVPFRQDSTFLYFLGCAEPGALALVEGDRTTLFLPEPAPDDALWHGEVASFEALRERYGVDAVVGLGAAAGRVPRHARALPVADDARNRLVTEWLGRPLQFGVVGDEELARAVCELRRPKDGFELDEMRRAATVSRQAHEAVIRATRPGATEARLAALFHGIIESYGGAPAYDTILTQRGEILHNHARDGVIEEGRLLLLDGGAEVPSGYGSDVTRTWPTSGQLDPRQRAAYEAVLEAQLTAISMCRPGVPYRDVHLAAARVLADWMYGEKLLKVDADTAVEAGAHAAFFPHGVGHLIGLDVHDLEAFGDLGAYPKGEGRSPQLGLSYLRLNLPLEVDWVVTIEPGFYVVPAILHDAALRARLAEFVDFDRAERWIGFGGIRIEDDVRVTDDEPEVLSAAIPKSTSAIEALVGRGPMAEDRLW